MLKQLFKWYVNRFGDYNKRHWKGGDTVIVMEDIAVLGFCEEATMLLKRHMDEFQLPYTLENVHRMADSSSYIPMYRFERTQLELFREGLCWVRPSKHVAMREDGRITIAFGAFAIRRQNDGVITLRRFGGICARIQIAWEAEYFEVHIPHVWHMDLSRNGLNLWTFGGGYSTKYHLDSQCYRQPWDYEWTRYSKKYRGQAHDESWTASRV